MAPFLGTTVSPGALLHCPHRCGALEVLAVPKLFACLKRKQVFFPFRQHSIAHPHSWLGRRHSRDKRLSAPPGPADTTARDSQNARVQWSESRQHAKIGLKGFCGATLLFILPC